MVAATLNFTKNQVYDGKLANLSAYDAVKYDRIAHTLTFYAGGVSKVIFSGVDANGWRDFENQFKLGNFFHHITPWAWFNVSAITGSINPATPRSVSVNFDTATYNLSS
jgi:hypothetical protein